MVKLPEPQRSEAFEAALEAYLAQCTPEEAAFWQAVRSSDADPFASYGPGSTATSTTTAGGEEEGGSSSSSTSTPS